MDESDAALLARARNGDKDALEALLTRQQARVYRFGLKMCRDPEDAKDVLQDTLLAMARGVRDFRGASSLSTWLYSIARSFCIKKRRKSKFAPREEEALDTKLARSTLDDKTKAPDDALAEKQIEHALERAVAALPRTYQEVLLLRDVEGLTAPEVAEVLRISVQAVKSRLHRARAEVRAQVAPLLGIRNESAAAEETCPDIATLFSKHLEDEISVEVCATMERHLSACARCRNVCDSLKKTLALCHGTEASVEVPPSVQSSVRQALRSVLSASA